jgi:WD repeat-containing protein 68
LFFDWLEKLFCVVEERQMDADMDGPQSVARYSYEPPWQMYSLAWCSRPQVPARICIGSYIETEANKLKILELNETTQTLESVAEADHSFPSTKTMWGPNVKEEFELLATTGTMLNVWKYEEHKLTSVAKLANARLKNSQGHTPPLTSFDWSNVTHHKIGAASVDSTCTIWNLEKQKIETQLIAHDKAVHDIAFSQKDCLFASVGKDGSMRLFDQRNLDHSTIMYEDPQVTPLMRLAWNKVNGYFIATMAMDIPGVTLIDIRRPSVALTSLTAYDSCINSIAWAPHSSRYLLCGTDDGCALVWDTENPNKARGEKEILHTSSKEIRQGGGPTFWHDCDQEVYQAQWHSGTPDQICLGMSNRVDIVQL